mmetsp:Transcript_62296/g.69729  ORF Transcript_62296/g.69729 Transcript_62296/m.69729 type:complete len:186 (+) Transcript_62296:170-727(+)
MDIVVSPHGAQLTGLPFLAGGGTTTTTNNNKHNNKTCPKLLEIFPPGYFLPDYFGSLAHESGIGYSYIYAAAAPTATATVAQATTAATQPTTNRNNSSSSSSSSSSDSSSTTVTDNKNTTHSSSFSSIVEHKHKHTRIVSSNMQDRIAVRKQNFCLNPIEMVEILREEIRSWCECYADKIKQHQH